MKKGKVTDYGLSWKSNGVYNSKLKPLYTAFLHSIKFKNCLFGATNTVKNSDKEKYVYSGYGITFNFIIFGADNSLSSHVDNSKNNFIILGLNPTFVINGSFRLPKKKLVLILLKQILNFV